ncbi:flavodoxin [Lysobacter arseniciresistens ZS79]|uniref:Flavodoxin n=1 Tax=Lysobacter arseniciresistens ZS79 TaxID=913325 RepID=A0A0A0F2E0_9GAMM|nr:NAD(P)H-dependent oxidoreductase [Lysobacter arseniciresistens]KGM56969.1 flavodoxin [Lysobacter arseniciresistens ZS79]
MPLSAFGLNCTLTASPAESSTQLLLDQVLAALASHGFDTDSTRIVDNHIKHGVRADEGEGDEWPGIRRRILDARVLVVATPIWMGQPSSLAKQVLERLNAFLGEIDDNGCYPTFGRVATVAVVGNEDGAHHVTAELYQGLADLGFTIPAAGATYWVGEAMHKTDYKDLDDTPEKTASTTKTLASNAAHLARLLRDAPYPPPSPQ